MADDGIYCTVCEYIYMYMYTCTHTHTHTHTHTRTHTHTHTPGALILLFFPGTLAVFGAGLRQSVYFIFFKKYSDEFFFFFLGTLAVFDAGLTCALADDVSVKKVKNK